MSSCFTFRMAEKNSEGLDVDSLILFFTGDVGVNSVIKAIKDSVQEKYIHHFVYLITNKSNRDFLDGISIDSQFSGEFESLIGDFNKKIKFIYVCGNGSFFTLDDKKAFPDCIKNNILQSGMVELFRKRNGVISSSDNYHFLKPSGDHCDKFIRASNLLISSNEVFFLSIKILPYLKGGVKRIYIDTSSIAYLILTAIQISDNCDASEISIESFESYTALVDSYDFVEDEHSLVFISATTSGSLAKGLDKGTNLCLNQIITLFHLGLPSNQIGLFDISVALPGGIYSDKSSSCKLCKTKRLIRISGDQFLPEMPSNELLTIKKSDFSLARGKFFKEFAKTGVLGCDDKGSPSDSREHFYVDVRKIVSNPSVNFAEDLARAVKRYAARDVNGLISLGDTGSDALAAKISALAGGLPVISAYNLDDHIVSLQSVMVVAGAITSGRTLLSLSRKLRSLDKSSTIFYFIGFSKVSTADALRQLKSDLIMGGHEFFILRECPMPRVKEYSKTAWDFEREFLSVNSGMDPLVSSKKPMPVNFMRRLGSIQNGLNSDDLFLMSPQGNRLELRRTFAFWSDLMLDDVKAPATQSDVYWTIQSVLHDLRINSHDKGLASLYHSTVISPVCFDRFNDGVIQSCFLRAAKPVELNYSVDIKFSEKMKDLLISVISNWKNSQGEAALEFLLAMACGRLKINDMHLREVVSLKKSSMPVTMRFLLDRLT